MTKLAFASLPRDARSIEPAWLAQSPLVGLVWVQQSHGIEILIPTLAAVLEPNIRLSHCRKAFGYKA